MIYDEDLTITQRRKNDCEWIINRSLIRGNFIKKDSRSFTCRYMHYADNERFEIRMSYFVYVDFPFFFYIDRRKIKTEMLIRGLKEVIKLQLYGY